MVNPEFKGTMKKYEECYEQTIEKIVENPFSITADKLEELFGK
jgi:hypothetical protein